MAHVGFPHRLDQPKYAGPPKLEPRRPERRAHGLQAFFSRKNGVHSYRAIPGIAESALAAANTANTSPRRRIDVRYYGWRIGWFRRIGNRRHTRAFLLTPLPRHTSQVARHRQWPVHQFQTYCTRIKPARSISSLRRSMLVGPLRTRSRVDQSPATTWFKTIHMRSKAACARRAHCPPADRTRHDRDAWTLAAAPSLSWKPRSRIGELSPPMGEVLG